ncbi:hypothetical protein M8J75_009116 [Diaphorina citri]|nr:hypothetical protein M8J75_009116 [Diaphorina citri]
MAVEIKLQFAKLLVVVLYKAPRVYDLNTLDEFLADHIAQSEHIIVMGDFNVNMLNPSALLTSRLTEIVSTYGLSVLPSEPTHHGLNGTSSQIDLTLTVQTERVKLYIQLPVPGISRHDMLCLAYSIKVPKYPVRMIRYRDFRRLDADVLSECLGEVRWMDVMSDNHIDHVDQKAMLFEYPTKSSQWRILYGRRGSGSLWGSTAFLPLNGGFPAPLNFSPEIESDR